MSPTVNDLTKKRTGYVLKNGTSLQSVPSQINEFKVEADYCKDLPSPMVDFSKCGFTNLELLVIEKNCFTTCNSLVFSRMLMNE